MIKYNNPLSYILISPAKYKGAHVSQTAKLPSFGRYSFVT